MTLHELMIKVEQNQEHELKRILSKPYLLQLISNTHEEDLFLLQQLMLYYLKIQDVSIEQRRADYVEIAKRFFEKEAKSGLLLLVFESVYEDIYTFKEQTQQIKSDIESLMDVVEKNTLSEADLYFFLAKCHIYDQNEHLIEEHVIKAIDIYDLYADTKYPKILERLGYAYKFLGDYYHLISQTDLAKDAFHQSFFLFDYLKDLTYPSHVTKISYLNQYVVNKYSYFKIVQKEKDFNKNDLLLFIDELRGIKQKHNLFHFYLSSLLYDYAECIEVDDSDLAIKLYEESLDTRLASPNSQHEDHSAMIGFTNLNIAKIYEKDESFRDALYFYDQALQAFTTKAQNDPSYEAEVGLVEQRQAFIYQKHKEYSDAEYHFLMAHQAYENASKFDSKYTYDFHMSQYRLAHFYLLTHDDKHANIFFVDSANYFVKYHDADLNRFTHYAGLSLFYAAKTCMSSGRYDLLSDYAQAAIIILNKLNKINEKKYMPFLAEIHFIYGRYLHKEKEKNEAVSQFESAIRLYEIIFTKEKTNGKDLYECYQFLIQTHHELEAYDQAMGVRFDCLDFLERYYQIDQKQEHVYQHALLELLALLLIDSFVDSIDDLIHKLIYSEHKKTLYDAVLTSYYIQMKNLSESINHFQRLISDYSVVSYDGRDKILLLGLINQTFSHDDLYHLWNDRFVDHMIQTMRESKYHASSEKEKDILLESSILITRYFEKTNQKQKIKEIEEFNLL